VNPIHRWLGYRPQRVYEDELMDDPEASSDELFRVYRELEIINRRLGGHGVSREGIETLVPEGPVQVLDVGAGGGDFARYLADWGRRTGRGVEVQGLELTPSAVEYARLHSGRYEGLRFSHGDLHDQPDGAWDVVHMSLTLHHFDDQEAVRMLEGMARVARRGVVVNDLHRAAIAYGAIKVLTGVLSRSRLVRNDAPLSVNRAFLRSELSELCRQAGLTVHRLAWRPMYRWLLVAS
jgi:2-polyprenyl-3-methyl-5-hydroxy-6-metoxy-1,4-benzoquinol methylase